MYRAPVADIAFTLKNSAGFATAQAEGIYQDLADDLLEACSRKPASSPPT